jgi:hypothetical protein
MIHHTRLRGLKEFTRLYAFKLVLEYAEAYDQQPTHARYESWKAAVRYLREVTMKEGK